MMFYRNSINTCSESTMQKSTFCLFQEKTPKSGVFNPSGSSSCNMIGTIKTFCNTKQSRRKRKKEWTHESNVSLVRNDRRPPHWWWFRTEHTERAPGLPLEAMKVAKIRTPTPAHTIPDDANCLSGESDVLWLKKKCQSVDELIHGCVRICFFFD